MIAKINLNSIVKVRLTETGRRILLDYYGGHNKTLEGQRVVVMRYPV